MSRWDRTALDLKPRPAEILWSNDGARAIALDLAAGESLADHAVLERARLVVVDREVEVVTGAMTIREMLHARRDAAKSAGGASEATNRA